MMIDETIDETTRSLTSIALLHKCENKWLKKLGSNE